MAKGFIRTSQQANSPGNGGSRLQEEITINNIWHSNSSGQTNIHFIFVEDVLAQGEVKRYTHRFNITWRGNIHKANTFYAFLVSLKVHKATSYWFWIKPGWFVKVRLLNQIQTLLTHTARLNLRDFLLLFFYLFMWIYCFSVWCFFSSFLSMVITLFCILVLTSILFMHMFMH